MTNSQNITDQKNNPNALAFFGLAKWGKDSMPFLFFVASVWGHEEFQRLVMLDLGALRRQIQELIALGYHSELSPWKIEMPKHMTPGIFAET